MSKKSKTTPREQAWLALVFMSTGLIWLFGSWRYALAFFLGTGVLVNLIKLVRGKGLLQ